MDAGKTKQTTMIQATTGDTTTFTLTTTSIDLLLVEALVQLKQYNFLVSNSGHTSTLDVNMNDLLTTRIPFDDLSVDTTHRLTVTEYKLNDDQSEYDGISAVELPFIYVP